MKSLLHKLTVSIALLFLSQLAFAVDQSKPLFEQTAVSSLVQDYANLLTPEEKKNFEVQLNQISRETSSQILLVTVTDLFGYDKNDYASRLGEAWGVGGKKDNGVVILILPKTDEHKGEISIQTGYGIEGLIPDITAERIVQQEMIPQFKNGQFGAGIQAAIGVIVKLTKGEFKADQYGQSESDGAMIFIVLVFFLILFVILKAKIKGGGQNFGSTAAGLGAASFLSGMGRPSSGGFGGFSSGSGGFGGFGGGSFGGGGAGGSW